MGEGAEQALQAVFAEFDVAWVVGFGDAVGVGKQDVARAQVNGRLLVAHPRQHADDGAPRRQFLHLRFCPGEVERLCARAHEVGRIVPGVHVTELPPLAVDLGVEKRRVLVARRRSIQELIHLLGQFRQRDIAVGGDDAQRRLHHGHDQRRRDALPGHVGQGDSNPVLADLDEVVVVPADAARRHTDGREVGGGREWRARRQQPFLYFDGERQVAAQHFLPDDAIGEPRILHHQRELVGAAAQHPLLRRAVPPVPRRPHQQQAHDLGPGPQRHHHPDVVLCQQANLFETLWPIRRRPLPHRLELIALERQRHQVGGKPAGEKSISGNDPLDRFERSDADSSPIAIVAFLQQYR